MDISKVVTALGKLFRLSLSKGKEFVSLNTEMEILRQYIFLQQVRFDHHLQAEFLTDSSVLECKCPKLLLQPIVENAVIHGIMPMLYNSAGEIKIYASQVGEFVFVRILNNGEPFDNSKSETIFSKANTSSYGMRNIKERLSLIYGEKAKIKICTNEEGWTEVTIIWPAEPYEQ